MNIKGRAGFTLLELLTVIVIIGILVAMTGTAAVALRKSANRKKRGVQKQALASAARTYYHEYNRWPVTHGGDIDVGAAGDQNVEHKDFLAHLSSSFDPGSGGVINEDKNAKNIHFIRTSDFEIADGDIIIDPVSKRPFKIRVNFQDDKFMVKDG